MKQGTFTDLEYGFRKKTTKREEFLETMDEIIPWDEWVSVIEPYYPRASLLHLLWEITAGKETAKIHTSY